MRALLLSAGIGSRLRPLTDRTPKCLVPILGRPLIDYWLDWTLGQGMEKVLINTHHPTLPRWNRPHLVKNFSVLRYHDIIEEFNSSL